jgi:hypothetical protein
LNQTLLHLELQLLDPSFRSNREKVDRLLTPEFREFGSSGTAWEREQLLEALAAESDFSPPSIEEFSVTTITPQIALATYETSHADYLKGQQTQRTLRRSIWVFRDHRWQILFHQGTEVPSAHDPCNDSM